MTVLKFAAATLQVAGTLMISFVLLSVHQKFKQDKQIDQAVVDEMNKEQTVVVVALILIALGWALLVIGEFREVFDKRRQHSVEKLILTQHQKNERRTMAQ